VRSLTYRPELDGLRCLAVYLVLLFHTGMVWAGGGFIGVDLFFVLSGFLVTQVIWAEVADHGSFDVSRFYARRVRRLLPAAVLVIVATSAVQLLTASQPQRLDMIANARAALLYFANWQFIADARDYFAGDVDASPFLHFWSLSIEEQFYIVYPLLLLLVVKLARRPLRAMAVLMGATVVVSVGLQVWVARDDVNYAYYSTQTRLYQLAAGALLAAYTLRRSGRRTDRRTPRRTPATGAAALLGVAALLVLGSGLLDLSASTRGLAAAVAAVVAIGAVFSGPRSLTSRALALPVPRYLGQISYGTYLWHWPLILLLRDLIDVRPLVLTLLAGTLATGLAALSFQVFETPIRRTRVLDGFRWPVVAAGLVVSVLAATLVVPQVLESSRRPAVPAAAAEAGRLQLASTSRELDRPVPSDLDLVAADQDVPDIGKLCTPDDLTACRAVAGDGLHVVLVGDSHAQMLSSAFRTLAREQGFTLSTSMVPACPWQDHLLNRRLPKPQVPVCRQARETFYRDVLPKLDADVVVVVGLARSSGSWAQNLVADGGGQPGETLEQLQLRTTEETAKEIRDTGAKLVMVKSMWGTNGYDLGGFDPIDCLARAKRLGDCVVVPPLEHPAVDGFYDTVAAGDDGAATVDLMPAFCPDAPLCLPVADGIVTWRDPVHVSGSYVIHQRSEIWDRLQATGLFD
jgi:peptidoglycan/LPS O-acetylase OafA/YrhL